MSNNIKGYLSNIYSLYKKASSDKQSLSEILNSFSQLNKDYDNIHNIKLNHNQYSSNNLFECTKEEQNSFLDNILSKIKTLVIHSIYDKEGVIWTWKDVVNLVINEPYSLVAKDKRKVVYSALSNNRPIGESAFDTWNGIQIIDLDIKNADLANKLKPIIFQNLSKYQWFIGISLSASRKSLHVWTKITPIALEHNECRIEYIVNFRHKYSYIYIVLLQYAEKLGYTKENIEEFIDMAMCKPQQGIFIPSDFHPLVNTNFIDCRLDVNFENAYNNGIESINWISHPDLKNIFHKLEWFNNDQVHNKVDLESLDKFNIEERNIKQNKKIHYKHTQRWQLANTLTSLYGETMALNLMCDICADTPIKELKGDVKTAAIHNKPISEWAIQALNKNHGFKIQIKKNNQFDTEEINKINDQIKNNQDHSIDPTYILNNNIQKTILHLNSNQFLSDIKEEIIKNLGKITLLEAGAGYGKTEMIKSLKEKTLLILPFTSTIKAKIEVSEVTKDWLYYYGNKKPTLEELMGNQNMTMTIDKFSNLNLMELDQANFKYIVIDESHLLFTSSYRSVMSPAIQRLANCSSQVIMMTGTPTGERLFFPGIKNIKVEKDDHRVKDVEIHMCYSKDEKIIKMCQFMAEDIINGKKILFPCNNGNLYFERIIGLIQYILEEKQYDKPLRSFYYKKSNYGDDSMINIDVNKSFGNNDLIMCTNYLSVGVDICDKFNFNVYFDQVWIPQDIEQFANRIRNNDLYIKIFLEKYDANNIKIDYNTIKPLDLNFENTELIFIRDLIQTCNDMLERNSEESKYNPLVSSVLTTNRYLKYDENDTKYYIDETAYKLMIFEERYQKYSTQRQVLINDLKYYGYQIIIINHEEKIDEGYLEKIEQLFKDCRIKHFNEKTIKTFKFLHHINDENIDIYKDILKGSYSIFKDDEYKEERIENNIYAEDLEIIMKNLPIYISLYKFYDPETIIKIFEYCKEPKSGRINYSHLERIRQFIRIEDNRRKKRLDLPIYKFIVDAKKYAQEHPYVTKDELQEWLANYTAKICNSIKNVVVEDIKYMDEIYDLLSKLFNVIIIKKTSKQGTSSIEPFKLLWESKLEIKDIFDGIKTTHEFFLQDLMNNMKEPDYNEEDKIIDLNYQIPHTQKQTIENIQDEIPNIVTKPFDYFKYSELDGSNDRFMKKQNATNQFRDNIFTLLDKNGNEIIQEKTPQLQLFEN